MNEPTRQFLKLLWESQFDGLPQSRVAKRFKPLVEKLKTCGAVAEQPVARGVKFVVNDDEAFESFVKSIFPRGLGIDPDTIDSRAEAVWAYANSKAVQKGSDEGVGVRSANPEFTVRVDDQTIPVGKVTSLSGGMLIRFTDNSSWEISGTIGIIENIENFWNYERVLPEVDLAIIASPITHKLIDWLGKSGLVSCKLIHWGDYDPVGVREYVRLKRAFPDRATTYIPEDIEKWISKFGQRERIKKQVVYLNSLRDETDDPIVAKMVSLFDQYRKGLDQELLLYSEDELIPRDS